MLGLGNALTLQGPVNSGKLALICLASEGIYHHVTLQTPPTALGYRPIKAFLSFSLSR